MQQKSRSQAESVREAKHEAEGEDIGRVDAEDGKEEKPGEGRVEEVEASAAEEETRGCAEV